MRNSRALYFLWLAVIKDPSLARARRDLEIRGFWTLTSESLFLVHSRLINLLAFQVDSYVADLLEDSRDTQNVIIGSIVRRLDKSVPVEGFIQFDLTPVFVP